MLRIVLECLFGPWNELGRVKVISFGVLRFLFKECSNGPSTD